LTKGFYFSLPISNWFFVFFHHALSPQVGGRPSGALAPLLPAGDALALRIRFSPLPFPPFTDARSAGSSEDS